MSLKYIVVGGIVTATDGDRHYIGPHKLMHLYGVSPSECLVMAGPSWGRGYSQECLESLKVLTPKTSGDYLLDINQ